LHGKAFRWLYTPERQGFNPAGSGRAGGVNSWPQEAVGELERAALDAVLMRQQQWQEVL
jgi:hypothetical protein